MSNLLKSKTFQVGGLVIAMAFAFAMMLSVVSTANAQSTTTTVVASGYTYSGVMKAGTSGPGISTLQAALNEVNSGTTIVVDGKFGPATTAAVMKFQASKGLTADGVVGPKTGAALAAATVAVITVPGGFPAGCTSNAGYSMTTGQSCAVSITLPAGCTSTAGFSSTTGVKCSGSTSTLPAGCTSTAGFSSTTGAKCSGGSTSTPNTGTLGGEEGDISSVNETSSDDSDVEEGQTNEIYSFETEIEGDVMIDRVDFYLELVDSTGGISEDAEDFFSGASLWVDGEQIAELDVDDFDQDEYDEVSNGTTDDDEYRLRFSGLDVTFSDGDEPEFVLAMDGANSIDEDEQGEEWRVSLASDSIRFVDGQGFTGDSGLSGTNGEEDFGFDEEGAGEELNIKSSSSDVNDNDTLLVEEDDNSDWYDMLAFRLESEEGDIDVTEVVFTVTTTGGNYIDMVDDVILEIDGEEFTDFDEDLTDPDLAVLTFDIDGDFTVGADETVDAVVKMRFHQEDGHYDDVGAETVTVATVSVEGEGADDVSDTATVTGGTKTLSTSVAEISGYEWDVNSTGTLLDFFFTVTAEDDDFDVLASSITESVVDAFSNIQDTAGTPETTQKGILSRDSGDSVVAIGSTGFTVEDGSTTTFRVRYTMSGTNGETTEVTITSVAGQEVSEDDQRSPTATLAVPS